MIDSKTIAAMSVRIGADTTGFRKGLTKTKSGMTALKGVSSQLKGMLVGMFSVAAITTFTKKAAELYDVQAKAEAGLLTALKGNSDMQQRLLTLAKERQDVTLYGDEETISGMTRLASILGQNEDAIKSLTPLVQDLATKNKMDLATAADLVAKSVGSSTNALSRYGIVITGAVGSSDRLNNAVEALNKQVGGQSEAAAKAGTGAIIQMKNAWGDMLEMIGNGESQAINNNARFMAAIFKAMAGGMEKNHEAALTEYDKFANKVQGKSKEELNNLLAFYEKQYKEMNARFGSIKVTDNNIDLMDALYAKRLNKFDKYIQILKKQLGSLGAPIKEVSSLLDIQNEKLKEENKLKRASGTEEELAYHNQRIKQYEAEIKRLNELLPIKRENVHLDQLSGKSANVTAKGSTGLVGLGNGELFDSKAADDFKRKLEILQDASVQASSIISDSFLNISDSWAEAMGQLLTNGKVDNLASLLLSPLADVAENMGKLAISMGLATLGIKAALKSLNPAVAIAAGAALIVLAKVVKSKLSAMSSGGGTSTGISSMSLGASTSSQSSSTEDTRYVNRRMGQAGNTQNQVKVTGRIRLEGRDLYLILENEKKRLNTVV